MNTRAKAAFSTADTLAVAKANCAPKSNPPRTRGGSKSTDSKRKEPATPTSKPKASTKGPSDPKPAPKKTDEKTLLPSSTPDDPKKARKGRQCDKASANRNYVGPSSSNNSHHSRK